MLVLGPLTGEEVEALRGEEKCPIVLANGRARITKETLLPSPDGSHRDPEGRVPSGRHGGCGQPSGCTWKPHSRNATTMAGVVRSVESGPCERILYYKPGSRTIYRRYLMLTLRTRAEETA